MITGAQSIRPVVSRVYEGRIDVDAVAAFALAANDPNPLYLTGQAVPPLYTACLVAAAQSEAQELSGTFSAITGWRGTVHGEHDALFWAPVLPGMDLRWNAVVHRVRQRSTGVVIVTRITLTDTAGHRLVEHHWSDFFIGGRVESELGTDPADGGILRSGPVVPAGSRTIRVDRDQAYRYAGVSGDHVGHAMDDVIARSEGYPSKILQGMCTFSLVSSALVDLLADGDPYRISRLSVRFSAPAFPGQVIQVGAYEGGTTVEGDRAFGFEAEQSGVTVLSRGRVELRRG